MNLNRLKTLLEISHSEGIIRRYFVVNGFDGALTTLGLVMGFYISDQVELSVVITSCLAAAVALGMSGISSAYISEVAERKRNLAQLEEAMVTSLEQSHHAQAAVWIPWLVALVNGIAPMTIALIIILPLWMGVRGFTLILPPLEAAMFVAFVIFFYSGSFPAELAALSGCGAVYRAWWWRRRLWV